MAATLGTLNPFRYRGYVYDEETGLYYLRSRYYMPAIGRFLNVDSTLGKPGQLFDHNVFAYCKNNPVNLIDKSGHAATLSFSLYRNPLVVQTATGYFGSHLYGEQMNRAFFMGGLLQMANENWTYRGEMAYGFVDCNGIMRFVAQQYYKFSAYSEDGYNIRTKVSEITKSNLAGSMSKIGNLDDLVPMMGLFSEDLSHMAIYIGAYGGYEHAIIESTPSQGVHISNLDENLYRNTGKTTSFSSYGYFSFVDYSTPLFKYWTLTLTVEDD